MPVASIVFTTYNQPDWLEKTLLGFAAQDRHDFEVLVADDGSGEETRARLEALSPRLPYAMRHLWQPDDGFRKCEALNGAIRAAASDYLVFTDGDCIPRRDFVSTHLRLRAPGRFLSGGYYKLPMDISRTIDADDIASGRCFDLDWLRSRGLPRRARDTKLWARGPVATLFDALSTARASWNGHNASGWKADLERVNGFDQRMGYGGEDRELGERLENAGIRGKRIRFRAIALHLDHPRGYVREDVIARNNAIRDRTRETRSTWTPHGIVAGDAPAGRAG
jgi:glycosyltransferase involved in cell wall biosynthesis